MKLKKMTKEELEQYSYEELTKIILEEEKKPLNTPTIFKKICDLLDLSEEQYADKIGDYYTSLTTDKNFVLLEDGTWDLRDHHPADIILEDDLEDEEDEEEITPTEDDEIVEDNLEDDSLDDIDDDDIEEAIEDDDLSIINEEELED